ncbi:hypothetical protein FACS189485_02120 [Spirochaetia bacterium]|nr:hypothetical protein FACS189485_02120 [Spirochaetia bacterium]
MGVLDVFKIKEFKQKISALEQEKNSIEQAKQSIENENKSLQDFIDEIGARDAITVKRKIEEYQEKEIILNDTIVALNDKINRLDVEIKEKTNEILVTDEKIMLESFALYEPKFKFLTSDEYKQKLDRIREQQKELIKNGTAAIGSTTMTYNGKESEGRKMVNDMIKLILRSFNNECDYCVDNVKFNNIEASIKRIEKSFETCNKLGIRMSAEITETYKNLKLDELYLAFEYQEKKEQEKEESKRAREELREQQKLEREIREAREKIAKERKHFSAAIKELEQKLKKATDEKEKELIAQNLAEAQSHFSDLEKEEKVIDYREQNAKAGYVYVISNIGAFGDGVYKIGMTRRLEPMERVDELSDASVPFTFDVHAMVFSDNAPELESKLHEYFYANRINKLNDRKEFFRADITEIEKVIKENYNKVVDVVKEAPAEQYRESLLIK